MVPKLVLVAGCPGAGKTTLATLLSRELPSPLLTKDSIKEGLSITWGTSRSYGGEIAKRTFAAFYACIETLLRHESAVVAEASFDVDYFLKEIAPLRTLAETTLVVCRVSSAIAAERYRTRASAEASRRLAHPDALVIEEMSDGRFPWEKYDLGDTGLRTLAVDTTLGYNPMLEVILSFIRNRAS